MTNIDATSSLQPIVASNKEPSSTVLVESCPDPACAPAVSSNKSTCAASDSAPSASPPTTQRIVTTVSSDESTKEVASASPDDSAVKDNNVPPVVHKPSTNNNDGNVCAPSRDTTDTTTKSNAGDDTAALSHDTANVEASAPKDNHLLTKCLPPVVHRPSASNNNNGIVGDPSTSKSNTGVATAISSTDAVADKTSAPKDNHLVKERIPQVVHGWDLDGIIFAPSTSRARARTDTSTKSAEVATSVYSDTVATEEASAPKGNHLVKERIPQVVHGWDLDGIIFAPSTSRARARTDTSTKSAEVATSVYSDIVATEEASAPKDNHLVKKCLPSVVHRPSASDNEDGIISAPGTSHAVVHSTGIAAAASSEQSTKVAARTIQPDTAATARVSNVHASNHLAIGEVRTTTTATEATSSSRVLTAILPTDEVGGLITKRLHGASIVAAPVEINAIENALAKKRKSEEEQLIAKKKAKVPKDPNAPKKHMTPYMHYATYARAWIKAWNPNVTATDATKTVREGWKEISDEARRFWGGKSAADKARYEKELAEYKKSEQGKAWQARVTEESEQAVSKSAIDTTGDMKKAEDSAAPKPKPYGTAYMHYSAYARAWFKSRNPSLTNEEVTKSVRDGWNDMDYNALRYWNDRSAADKARYEKELAEYKKSELGQAWQWQASVAAESKQATSNATGDMKKTEYPNAPKPNQSAYVHYIGYALTQIGLAHPRMKDAEVTKAVQRGWDTMIAEVRNYWDGIAAADKVRYQNELARFNAGF